MKVETFNNSITFLVLSCVFILAECAEFKCEVLNPLKEVLGETIYVPEKSTAPFSIPKNFNCTIHYFVPNSTYLRLTVINYLSGKDYIQFSDAVGYRKTVTSNFANEELYATSGKGQVQIVTGAGGESKALLIFEWMKMPSSNWIEQVQKNQSGINVDCMELQLKPITFQSEALEKRVMRLQSLTAPPLLLSASLTNDASLVAAAGFLKSHISAHRTPCVCFPIALSIAHSGYILDSFDSYFIFDGSSTESRCVGRLSSYMVIPFIPSGQFVTIIGLTTQVVYSNIIANIQSNLSKYRKYEAAVVVDQLGGSLGSINQTIGVTFVAKDSDQLYITSLTFNEVENEMCQIRVISGTPSPASQFLLSYTPLSPVNMSFPQQFPASQVTIEVSDCSVYMVITKNTPSDFFKSNNERIGYIFTPSFLESQLPSTLNITLSSDDALHYSTVVESVDVIYGEQLAINVYNSKGVSAMSVIVTGNQTGGSAEAIGTSVNINFNGTSGHGRAKIRYHISKTTADLFIYPILMMVLCVWR